MKTAIALLATGSLALSACATGPSVNPATRDAATGAAIGSVIGAAIGNNVGDGDAKTGAAIGAVVGALGGTEMGARSRDRQSMQRYYDRNAGRYYTIDPRTGATYWEDGSLRTR